MKIIFKLISFICGACVYSTVCLVAMMGYVGITNEMIKIFPRLLYPDLMKTIVFIGIMSVVSMIYGKIKDMFFEPTIRVKITKKIIENDD